MNHSTEFETLVDDAKSRVREVTVKEAMERQIAGAYLIDVREDNEWDRGRAKDAIHMGRGVIERDIVQKFPNKGDELILYCGGGYRSALAADNLQKMGYTNVFSMAGGWKAWKDAGGDVEQSRHFGDAIDKGEKAERGTPLSEARERVKAVAAEFADRGDPLGWFEEFYRESAGDTEKIPWADLEPNKYFREWAESVSLKGEGRSALVVGCGLGDDANYLDGLGFNVTAFDISPTAIEWARKLYKDSAAKFLVADLFDPPKEWYQAFDLVLEIYTIQPLPMEMRPAVIDAISNFVKPGGELVVVTRGREDDEEPVELPWPLSRKDLSRFEVNGLRQIELREMPGDEETPAVRFVVQYRRLPAP